MEISRTHPPKAVPQRTATQNAATQNACDEGFVADVFVGANKGIQETVEGMASLLLHPIETLKGLTYAVTHPVQAVKAMIDPYVECFKSGHPGEAIGRGAIDFGDLFIGKFAKGLKVAEASQVSEAAQAAQTARRLLH